MLWLDFETRSRYGLRTGGVYNYARDPSTEVLCMSYAFDNDEVQTWVPSIPFPERVANYKGQIRAHNAAFERLIFWHVLDMPFKLTQFYCTAAQARANCLPGSLEDLGRALGASMKKDHRGAALIRQLSIPRADGTFREDADLMAEMVAYCEQDVRTMRAASAAMRDLSETELKDYHVNERINDRGVCVDVPLCEAAVAYAEQELKDIEQLVVEITEGALTSVRSPRMREWVAERLGPEARKLMTVYKDGEAKTSIDKSVRANLLAISDPEQVPPHVADVIQCADDLWASSVAKFQRLAQLAGEDHRVRGAFVFAGGSATGRASSYGAQVHNFTRRTLGDAESARHSMVRGHSIVPAYGKRVTDVLRGMLRPALIPARGHVLVVADWSAIEARATPWLAADPQADAVLDVFRAGEDIYKREAAGIYRCTPEAVTDEQRQIGKVAILSLGFAGGVGAFAAMGRNYGITMRESDAQRIVDAWRRANQWAVRYWQSLESAYMRAMRNPGREFSAGRVTYLYDKLHLWYMLPSGRVLCYPFAKIEEDGISYVKAAWKPAQDATEWPRARLWRGLACENITQATANDLLRHALRELEACADVVLHVHDEIVVECREEDAKAVAQRLESLMCTAPEWAAGFPLKAVPKMMRRYGK
jgi:DNA polymerase